jgi:hypothetical protein
MKTLLLVTLLFALAPVGNCRNPLWSAKHGPELDADKKITIYYGRGGCPFNCPVYSMTIRPDRSVEYEGQESTRVLGKHTYTISVGAYQTIINAVERAQVERLADEYKPVPGRDSGTVIMRFSWGKRTKQIIHFLPSPDLTQELLELEEAIVKNAYPSQGGKS